MPEGRLSVVATPIGNLADLTPRAAEALTAAEMWLVEDTRVSGKLQAVLGVKKPMRLLNEHTNPLTVERYAAEIAAGLHAAVLTDGGAPGISDPGADLVDRCHTLEVRVEPLPGASAVVTALMASGFYAQRFVFLGFLPRKPGPAKAEFAPFAGSPMTLVAFESPHRIDKVLAYSHAVLGARRVVLARELTKLFEQVWRGRLPDIPLPEVVPRKGEFTIVWEGKRKKLDD